MRNLLRKTLVWLPAISFNAAVRASLGAAHVGDVGGLLYAGVVTVLAAITAILLELHVRRLLRRALNTAPAATGARAAAEATAEATAETALAHDLTNLVSNALGLAVGNAWAGYASRPILGMHALTTALHPCMQVGSAWAGYASAAINPPVETTSTTATGSNWSGLLILALALNVLAVVVALWVADQLPSRQAALIVNTAVGEAQRRQAPSANGRQGTRTREACMQVLTTAPLAKGRQGTRTRAARVCPSPPQEGPTVQPSERSADEQPTPRASTAQYSWEHQQQLLRQQILTNQLHIQRLQMQRLQMQMAQLVPPTASQLCPAGVTPCAAMISPMLPGASSSTTGSVPRAQRPTLHDSRT